MIYSSQALMSQVSQIHFQEEKKNLSFLTSHRVSRQVLNWLGTTQWIFTGDAPLTVGCLYPKEPLNQSPSYAQFSHGTSLSYSS